MSNQGQFPDPTETAIFGAIGGPSEAENEPTRRVLSAHDQAAVDQLPYGSALLVVQRGPNVGARFLLDTERITAGRHPRSDIFLDDVTVSRKHCVFVARDGGYAVEDTTSLNGTYVNRERIDSAFLNAGDEVQIGKFRLAYYPSPAVDAQ